MIFGALFAARDFEEATLAGLAREAKISRATIYRHYRSVRRMRGAYERRLVEEYGRMLRRVDGKVGTYEVFECMLVFMMRRRRVFRKLLRGGAERMMLGMIRKMKPWLVAEWGGCDLRGAIFEVYVGEVYALIRRWARRGMREKEAQAVVRDLVRLTRAAVKRLGGLECE